MYTTDTSFLARRRFLQASCAVFFMLMGHTARAQNPSASAVGLWRVMNGSSAEPVSLVAISEHDGVLSGTVMRVMHSAHGEHPVCTACKGDLKDKPVVGLTILWGLKQDGTKPIWAGGSVLDPAVGQTYKCKLTLKDEQTLEVRGYLGISLMGRSQVWKRAQPQELTAPATQPAATQAGPPA